MREISEKLLKHLQGNALTLAVLWELKRTDGQSFYITSHDRALNFEGIRYESNKTFNQSATEFTSSFSVDNFELEGVLNVQNTTVSANSNSLISYADISAGIWDNTKVKVLIVNFESPDDGCYFDTFGTFGKFKTTRSTFTVEFRGPTEFLNNKIMKITQPLCNANFCDKRCGLSEENFKKRGVVEQIVDSRTFFDSARMETNAVKPALGIVSISRAQEATLTIPAHGYSAGDLVSFTGCTGGFSIMNGREYSVIYINLNNFKVSLNSTEFEEYSGGGLVHQVIIDEFFRDGKIKFLSGNNAFQTFDIGGYKPNSITLYESLVYPLQVGDEYEIIQGCSKTLDKCEEYDNVENFRGTPHIPGLGKLIAGI